MHNRVAAKIAVVLFTAALCNASHGQNFSAMQDLERCDQEKFKNPQLALQYCDRVLKNPDSLALDDLTRALVMRGQAHERAREFAKAFQDYAQAIKTNPFKGEGYFLRGQLYGNNLDNQELAIKDLTEAMKLGYGTNTYFRGAAYFRKGEFDKAIADYTKFFETKLDKTAITRKDLGDVWRGKGDFQRAIAEYTEAIRIAPDNIKVQFRNSRAITYFDAGLLDEAEAEALEVSRNFPKLMGPAYLLELIDRRKGRPGRLTELAPNLDMTPPFGTVIDMFLDRATTADVLRTFEAAGQSDENFRWLKRNRICIANHLIGLHLLSRGQKGEAARHFRSVAVASECPWLFGPAKAHLALASG